jgi:HAD superfamily hydrolase (TIGR01509 family)
MSLPQFGGTPRHAPARQARKDGPPRAVLFDFGGTLDADGVPWSQRFYVAYRAAGGSLRAHLFDELFKASDRALERLEGVGRLGFRAMIDAQAELLRASLPDGDTIDASAMAEQFHTESLRVIDRNRELLAQLQRDHRLAVISNFTGNLERCLDELGLLQFFGAVTDSAVVGRVKPSPELFVDTLRGLGVPPERAWMVGDNFEADIRPALQLGIHACWLASPGRPAPAGCEPSARIARLPELHGILAHGALCTD